jgi:endoglucanase
VPFVGEYGAYDQVPMDQRVAYYRTVSAAFASAGIQSCAWGYTNTFHLWRDGDGWNRDLLDSISTTTTLQ